MAVQRTARIGLDSNAEALCIARYIVRARIEYEEALEGLAVSLDGANGRIGRVWGRGDEIAFSVDWDGAGQTVERLYSRSAVHEDRATRIIVRAAA